MTSGTTPIPNASEVEGGYYTRLTFPHNSGPIAAIAKAARSLIDAHLRK